MLCVMFDTFWPVLFTMLLVFSGLAALISALCLGGTFVDPGRIAVSEPGRPDKMVRYKDAPTAVRDAYRRRFMLPARYFSSTVLVLSLSFLAWSFLSGEVARQDEVKAAQAAAREEAAVTSLIENTRKSFIEPLPEESAVAAVSDEEPVTMAIVLPDGEETTAEFKASWLRGQGADTQYALTPAGMDERQRLERLGWEGDAEKQRSWALATVVFPELEEKYGVTLQPEQREALALPGTVPSSLTRYGSTEMTVALDDGTYFNGRVTLIWDSEFKLIGSEGTDRAEELTRR